MRFPSSCFVGRVVLPPGQIDGPMGEPCAIPAENELATDPPMYFCSPHYQQIVASVDHLFIQSGHAPPAGLLRSPAQPPSDGLEERWGTSGLDQGQ